MKRRRRVCCIVIVKFVRSFPSLVRPLQTIILQIGDESRHFVDKLCQDITEASSSSLLHCDCQVCQIVPKPCQNITEASSSSLLHCDCQVCQIVPKPCQAIANYHTSDW